MNKVIKKVLMMFVMTLCLTTLISNSLVVKADTEESAKEAFQIIVLENYEEVIFLNIENNIDNTVVSTIGQLWVVLGKIGDDLSLSLFYSANYEDTYLKIIIDNSSEEWNAPNGYGEIYNMEYDYQMSYRIEIWEKEGTTVFSSYDIPRCEDFDRYVTDNPTFVQKNGNGTNKFPSDTLVGEADFVRTILLMMMVGGIFVIGILLIIITFIIVKKKTNIKRETFQYYDPRNPNQYFDQRNQNQFYDPNRQNQYYDQRNQNQPSNNPQNNYDETPSQEIPLNNVVNTPTPQPQKTPEEEMRELYRLRFQGKITEEQLNDALRKFKTYRDED